ncbi:MAG: cytochrome c5 family protein [Betaproteobacteria bacterium]|nr:cytochrome c5 family protein [Betaproteobacteria bacterium]
MPRLPSPAARRDAMNEPDQHSSPIKTPKQLIIVVVLAFVVPIALIILITQLVTGRAHGTGDDASILTRIAPFGVVKIAAPSGPKGNLTGEQVYGQVCKTCHEAGIAGAHKLGDKAAWGKVIAQGEKLTVQHAIAGIRAMPPRGGNADRTDAEVQRAVAFMGNKAGASWKDAPVAAAPAAAKAAAAPAAAPAAAATPAAAASVAPAAVASATPAKTDGKKAYDTACVACHGMGIAGAPKFGDKAAWSARIAQGANVLHDHAIKGYQGKAGVMPPKGGAASMPDADVKAAVDYMVAAAK